MHIRIGPHPRDAVLAGHRHRDEGVRARGLGHADEIRQRLDVPRVAVGALGVGDRLGPDTEDDGLVAIGRVGLGRVLDPQARSAPSAPVITALKAPFCSTSRAGSTFIAGEPMKVATNRFDGVS
jgi:hypothetical protein